MFRLQIEILCSWPSFGRLGINAFVRSSITIRWFCVHLENRPGKWAHILRRKEREREILCVCRDNYPRLLIEWKLKFQQRFLVCLNWISRVVYVADEMRYLCCCWWKGGELNWRFSTRAFCVHILTGIILFVFGNCFCARFSITHALVFNLKSWQSHSCCIVTQLDLLQAILSEEVLALKFLDVVTILLKYCAPKATEKGETQAVIIDLVGTIGFFCVNHKANQDLLVSPEKLVILKSVMRLPNEFQVAIYPTLVTVVWKNDAARVCIANDFDVQVSEAGNELSIEFTLIIWWSFAVSGRVPRITVGKEKQTG